MSKKNIERPRLSILLVTYNQESYIREALDSIFRQVFEGQIELIIADDASTDNTLAIINEYEGMNSRFQFKILDSSENLGITKNYQRAFSACTGEYVAIMEGDDYWVSPLKLQRQVMFLDNHWECNLCAVNYFVLEENQFLMYPRTTVGIGYRFLSSRDQIKDNLASNFSTCMYRKTALDSLPKGLFEIESYDWIVNICVAKKSMIGFLEEPMSVYRLHSKGVWTHMSYIKQIKKQLELIPAYDELTNQIYHTEFELLSHRLQSTIYTAKIPHVVMEATQPTATLLSRIGENCPPILLMVIQALIPPKIKHLIIRILRQDTV